MAEQKLLKPLSISLGDPAGIGPEILHQSLEHCFDATIFGPAYCRPKSLPQGCRWVDIPGHKVQAGEPSKESGQQAYLAFEAAALAVSQAQCSALVTLPLAKEYVALSVEGFHGHTDVLETWWPGSGLMTLLGGDLVIALITDHEAIKDLPQLITLERVLSKARILRQDIKRYFTHGKEPSINVLGLNPHAGENGLLGTEDLILKEAIEILKGEGGNFHGPWAADTFFARRDFADAVLACYHDQGLIPVKMLAAGKGVNVTLGLEHIRTSPDHGTAFDIAGKGQAEASSFVAALELARELASQNF